MQAYDGDFIPDINTEEPPASAKEANERLKLYKSFDLAVIAVCGLRLSRPLMIPRSNVHGSDILKFALDSFEPPNLTYTHQRYRRLLDNLLPIVDRLRNWGTLLIIDVQKTSELAPKLTLSSVTEEGYKIAGMSFIENYH